jgi:hypothetical protein
MRKITVLVALMVGTVIVSAQVVPSGVTDIGAVVPAPHRVPIQCRLCVGVITYGDTQGIVVFEHPSLGSYMPCGSRHSHEIFLGNWYAVSEAPCGILPESPI